MSSSRRKLILIVEDDPASLLLATATLEGAGYAVDGAGSAEQAREVLVDHKPDLILMDIRLPGIDGLEFTKELKASPDTAAIPVVALTANAMPLYQRSARIAGCAQKVTYARRGEALRKSKPLRKESRASATADAR